MASILTSLSHLLPVAARSLLSLALVIAIFAPLEHFFSVRKAKLFYPGWSTDLIWYFVSAVAAVVLLGPPAAMIARAAHAIVPTSFTGAVAALPLWSRMILAMVVGEIGFYWGHRWSHEIQLLWRFHAVHHSATHIGFLVNTRAHPVDMVFTRLCGMVLLYGTGLTGLTGPNPTLIPAIVLFVGSMWSFFIHANLRWRLGPFEEILATPAFHHWHHTLEDHKDHNYASMLPVMDRVFGTFYLPKTWPEAYGTSTPMPDSVAGQLIEPFAPHRAATPPNAAA